jgi:peptide/nickel transport system ATP-binding protein
MSELLSIRSLSIRYPGAADIITAVDNLNLTVKPGECVALVGESGAGKSQAFQAALRLLPRNAQVEGQILFSGQDLLRLSQGKLNKIRGRQLVMVFQDPLSALTPHLTIAEQISEPLHYHMGMSARAARHRACELLERVKIDQPAHRLRQYPHELSGGMRQRVALAMALACEPALLIADEPTTALDVTVQAQILQLLVKLRCDTGMAIVLVTHDWGVVASLADRVAVMHQGRLIESGSIQVIMHQPQSEQTRMLIQSGIDIGKTPSAEIGVADSSTVAVELRRVTVRYPTEIVSTLEHIDLQLHVGDSLGVVGESGSGKSTLIRAALRLLREVTGTVVWFGRETADTVPREWRRDLQLVFQDPVASLSPRMTVAQLLREPLQVHGLEKSRDTAQSAIVNLLQQVALPENILERYPHELSGGQCQRVALARALILKPQVLICDEAVSALDKATQLQVIVLIEQLRRQHQLALLFVSHDLAVVRRLCRRTAVLYMGHMLELGLSDSLFTQPAHPYTRALLDAVPVADPTEQHRRLQTVIPGEPVADRANITRCVFADRCRFTQDICRQQQPLLQSLNESQVAACHRAGEWHNSSQLSAPGEP